MEGIIMAKMLAETAGEKVIEGARGARLLERAASEGASIETAAPAALLGARVLDNPGPEDFDTENLEGEGPRLEQHHIEPESPRRFEERGLSAEKDVKKDMDREIRYSMEEFLTESREAYLQAERNPSKMPADAARRLAEKSDRYNEERGAAAGVEERVQILREMYRDMAEEACIPSEVIDKTQITPEKLGSTTNAATPLFIGYDAGTDRFSHIAAPKIGFNLDKLSSSGYTLEQAAETLYHETVHIMQMQCLTESGNTFSYMEQKLEWADDIKERLSGMNPEDFMAYLQEPMETYAHQQGAVFSKMYTAARAEKGEIPGLLREEEAIAYQAGGAAFESSDYYTTRAIREYGKGRIYSAKKELDNAYKNGEKVPSNIAKMIY